jgi:quercetin dioxygenase-like cupin family protein
MSTSVHTWEGVQATVYYLDRGEEIPRHQHPVEHTTVVVEGRTEVTVFSPMGGDEVNWCTMKKGTSTYVLPANLDHQIRALEHGTIVLNMIKSGAATYDYAPGDKKSAGRFRED